jgi:hypothetical protein
MPAIPGVLRFYWSLLREVPPVFRGTLENWLFWIFTVVATVIAVFNPEVVQVLSGGKGAPRWVGAIPLGLALVYGFLRANYQRHVSLLAERDSFKVKSSLRQDCLQLSDEILALVNEVRRTPEPDFMSYLTADPRPSVAQIVWAGPEIYKRRYAQRVADLVPRLERAGQETGQLLAWVHVPPNSIGRIEEVGVLLRRIGDQLR